MLRIPVVNNSTLSALLSQRNPCRFAAAADLPQLSIRHLLMQECLYFLSARICLHPMGCIFLSCKASTFCSSCWWGEGWDSPPPHICPEAWPWDGEWLLPSIPRAFSLTEEAAERRRFLLFQPFSPPVSLLFLLWEKEESVGLGPVVFQALFLQRPKLWLAADLLPPSALLVKPSYPSVSTTDILSLSMQPSSPPQHCFCSPSTDVFVLWTLSLKHSSAPASPSFLGLDDARSCRASRLKPSFCKGWWGSVTCARGGWRRQRLCA